MFSSLLLLLIIIWLQFTCSYNIRCIRWMTLVSIYKGPKSICSASHATYHILTLPILLRHLLSNMIIIEFMDVL